MTCARRPQPPSSRESFFLSLSRDSKCFVVQRTFIVSQLAVRYISYFAIGYARSGALRSLAQDTTLKIGSLATHHLQLRRAWQDPSGTTDHSLGPHSWQLLNDRTGLVIRLQFSR